MSLVRAELRRLFKRRIAKLMLALVLALMATVAAVIAVENQKPGPAARAEAQAALDAFMREQEVWIEQDIARCEEAQRAGTTEAEGWPTDCQEIRSWMGGPDLESFMPPTFEFRTGFPEMITVFTALLALFGFIVGASFVGAEWRSGGMTNLLLWRPRRLSVLGAKLLALMASSLGLGVLLGAVWTGGFWLIATYRGITDTMTSGAWQSIGLTGVRGLTLILVAGAVGFGLASLGRHTALAMGAAIAAFVVGVAGVGIILGGMLQVSFFERWMWATYVRAWMEKSVVLEDWNAPPVRSGAGEFSPPTMELTWQHAGIGMAVLVVVTLAAAMWHMRSRDVT